jgi:hypothetical protein
MIQTLATFCIFLRLGFGMKSFCIAFTVVIAYHTALAGGLRGQVKSDDGKPLPYASVFVRQTGSGAVTDADGRYELTLAPGKYDLLFQYLGYETQALAVEVGDSFTELDVTLKTQVIVLQTVTIRAGKEDPAYTIMRKAIAKAKFHTQQIDAYSAKVYIKGRGQLKDYPWLAKKALEKEGITKDRVFIQESVSEIKYTRPRKFEEKVIAVYTNGNNQNSSPNAYVFGSFYEPEIAETVSPLSPRSFSYYKFEYLGSFKDRNYEVSKIKVTPRSRGDNVFEGTLYIVEDWWSIHSLDLKATKVGINFYIKQLYNPIDDKAWLPVSQTFKVDGKVFGFEFEGQYLATVKDYKITMNPELEVEMNVIDEKLEKEEAKRVEKTFSKKNQQLQQRLNEGKEISDKELRQLVKEYEKQEQKEQKEPDVLFESNYAVDSLAYKKDSAFWADMRPVPLTKEEIRGYFTSDSLAEVERKEMEGDTLGRKKKGKAGFQPWDILTGDSYSINKTSSFEIHAPFGGFNTVDGFFATYRLSYYKRWVKTDSTRPGSRPRTSRLEISPLARYAFSRNAFTGTLKVDYRSQNRRLTLTGGRYIQQFNADNPIHPLVNGFTSLFLGDNWMKIYEQDFVDLRYRERLSPRFTVYTYWTAAKRYQLINTTDYTFFKSNREQYTPNAPSNDELLDTNFPNHRAFVGTFGIETRPWLKYRIRNGDKIPISESSPVFSLEYRKGFKNILGSDIDFDQVEASVRYGFDIGIRGRLDFAMTAGTFLNTNRMYFMDYAHFMGNRTPFVTTDPVGSFRLLDYYRHSTNQEYFTANVHYHFRKFLITRIPKIRLVGIQENIFVNYLQSATSKNYTELGYGIDGILRIFRLEAAVALQEWREQTYGFRIGIASSIGVNFAD